MILSPYDYVLLQCVAKSQIYKPSYQYFIFKNKKILIVFKKKPIIVFFSLLTLKKNVFVCTIYTRRFWRFYKEIKVHKSLLFHNNLF